MQDSVLMSWAQGCQLITLKGKTLIAECCATPFAGRIVRRCWSPLLERWVVVDYCPGFLHRRVDPQFSLVINPMDGDFDVHISVQISRQGMDADSSNTAGRKQMHHVALARESVLQVRYLPHLGIPALSLLRDVQVHARSVRQRLAVLLFETDSVTRVQCMLLERVSCMINTLARGMSHLLRQPCRKICQKLSLLQLGLLL
jgi:hypothetical protein